MSNNGKQKPFVPTGGGAWKKLGTNVQPSPQLSVSDLNKKLVLKQLTGLFGSVIEQNVIETIANSCGWDVQVSIEALMEISANVNVVPPSNIAPQTREMKPRQSPSTAPALQAIKVAYEGYDDSSDDADVIIEDEEEVQIVQNVPPPVALPSSNSTRTQFQSKPAPKVTKRISVKNAQTLEIDVITESINRGIKIMVLMRGVPGSGKSFLARKLISDSLLDAQPEQFIFSTDDFFCQSGHYVFAPQKLPEAHEWNRMRVAAALHRGTSPIIVDNTNTEVWEMKPYVFPAVHYGYAIEILEPSTPWCRKESELCRRNMHGVPRQNIRNMLERFEKTSVADLMSRFACSYAYGNTPPQPCSNKPKLKSTRKAPRENGGRNKSFGEMRKTSEPIRSSPGKNTKTEELQVNKVLPQPLPQRVPKQASSTTERVTPPERNTKAEELQNKAIKSSELSAEKLADIESLDLQCVNADSNLKNPESLSLGDGDILSKMKREIKASLRSQGPREETGDLVQEMFKEDVLVRLGQRETQWVGLSVEARLEAMDREVEQLMDDMWVHFAQLNGSESVVSCGDNTTVIEAQSGKDGATPLAENVAVNNENVAGEVETEPEKAAASTVAEVACEMLGAAEAMAGKHETEPSEGEISTLVEGKSDCEKLAANENLEISKDVAADLIEDLIKSVDTVLTLAEGKENTAITKDIVEVPEVADAIEQEMDVAKSVNVPSLTEDASLSAEYSLVDSVQSNIDSPLVAETNTGGRIVPDTVNDNGTDTLGCSPASLSTESFNQESSIAASGSFSEVSLPVVLSGELDKPAPKQSGLFSWLFPKKPSVSPASVAPSKPDFALGCSDPSLTAFHQDVNCSPDKQLGSIGQDTSVETCDSKPLEVSSSTESNSSETQSIPVTVNKGDTPESSRQEFSPLANNDEFSLLVDSVDLNDHDNKPGIDMTAEGQTESLENKCKQTASDALALIEKEEHAIDVLLSELSPDKLQTVTPPVYDVPIDSTSGADEMSKSLDTADQSFKPLPSSSMPVTDEKSEELNQTSQPIETLLAANPSSEPDEISKDPKKTESIPDFSGFTNPWTEVAKIPISPPPPPSDSKPRKPKATRDSTTNTTHADFRAADGGTAFLEDSTVVTTRGRSINDDAPAPSPVDEEERMRPTVFSLDKGCMTSPVENEPRQHDFDLLVNMFPRIGVDDLREVFDKCRHEINWAVELLLESGYDFEPRDDVDTGFDVAQGLETTQHLLEELNTRDLGMIQEASATKESSPHKEPSSFQPDSPKLESSSSSPTTKKSLKKPSQLTLSLQRQVESSVRIGESFYSEHTLKLRRQRHGIHEPEAESSETELTGLDFELEPMENEDEVVVPLTLDAEFLQQLQRLFGQLPFQYPEGVPPVVQLPVALARQIHGYLIESQQQQLDKQEEYFQNMIKDEEFARRLQQEEMPAPDLREIMDMELALELYRASQREPNPTKDDLATRLSRQKLLQQFPNVNRDVLAEVFAAHDYSFAETVAVIEASVKADGEPVKNVLSPEALLVLEKQLIKQAQEESKKQLESSGAVGGGEWSAVGARETPTMDSARNFREEALRLVQLRGECFRKANDAHRNGQTAVASYYAQVGHLYKEHIEEANSRAAAALLAANAEDRQSTTLDLHFLYVAEALEALDIFLDHHVAALATAGASDSRQLFIITGAGQHSAGGRARIKPAVERRLTQRKAKFAQVNPGMLKVIATKHLLLSSSL